MVLSPPYTQDGIMRGLRQRGQEEKTQDRTRTAGAREQIRLDRYRMDLRMRHERELGLEMRRQASFQLAGERQRAAALRETARHDRYRMGLRTRHERDEAASERRTQRDEDRRRVQGRRDLRSGLGRANDAGGRIMGSAHTISIGAGITAGIVAKIAETGLGARSRTDTAEANLRMFGGLNRSQVEAARRGWINRSAVENGFRPADAINSFTEALKAGIPENAAPDVTKSIMGGAAGLDLNVAETTKLVGRLSTLTQDPKLFSTDAIDKMLNGIAVVAKVTAADSNELVSSLRRGAGVLGSSKMSVSDLTAFTGIGISTGMQEGKAGTFMDFLVNELVNAKNARGQRREDLSKGFGMLGLGSNSAVSRQAASDPTALLLNMFERMSKMNPEKAGHVASLIGMREWRGEILQMMRGTPMLRQTVEAGRDPKNANHLKQARDERLGTLAGLRSQLVATFDLAWEAVGGGIEDIVREIGNFFLGLGKSLDFDVIKAHVKTLIDGFVDGLGFKSITEMLDKSFGKPNLSTVNAFFRFAQGFGQGVREVIDTLKSIVKLATGQDGDAGALGRWAARITGVAVALSMLSPFIGVLAGLGGAVVALAFALSKLGNLGSLGGLARGLLRGFGLGLAAEIGAKRGEIATLVLDAIKSMWAAIKEGLIEGFSIKSIIGVLRDELTPAPLKRWMDGGAKVEKQSYGGDSPLAGLIQNASYNAFNDGDRGIDRVAESIRDLKSLIHLATMTGSGVGANLTSAAGSAATGLGGGGASGLTGSFKPEGMKVPGWYGASRGVPGAGGGSASSNPANSSASARMLDAIAGTESGKASYNAVLGNGRYGTPSKPVSQMTLDEAFAFGRQIKARHGSSSALGRYQIVGNTMRAAQRALGISGDATFDPAMQDRMARWIARSQGLGAWEGLKGNPRAMAAARAAMAAGGALDSAANGAEGIKSSIAGRIAGLGELRIKSREATAGGPSAEGTTALARVLQGSDVAGGLKRFTAFNDLFHKGRRSKHNEGLAFDFTLNDPRQSAQAAEQVRARLRAAGLDDGMFRVLDEYRSPSGHATGGHIHTQFNSQEAAAKFSRSLMSREVAAVRSMNSVADAAKRAQDRGTDAFKSTGWRKAAPGTSEEPGFTSTGWRKPTTDEIVSRQPAGIGGRGGGGGSGGHGSGSSGPVTINVNGAGELPDVLAQKVQMRITKDWNHRAHDLEPELT